MIPLTVTAVEETNWHVFKYEKYAVKRLEELGFKLDGKDVQQRDLYKHPDGHTAIIEAVIKGYGITITMKPQTT